MRPFYFDTYTRYMRGGFSALSVHKHDVILLQTLIYHSNTCACFRLWLGPRFTANFFRSEV
jgi:hypothetical protein